MEKVMEEGLNVAFFDEARLAGDACGLRPSQEPLDMAAIKLNSFGLGSCF